MTTAPPPDFEPELARFCARLPARIGRALHWLMQPSSIYVRIPAGLLLVAGGLLGFLPILGFWMIPLGLILLAVDVPPLRPAIARLLAWIARKWPPPAQTGQ